MYGLLSAWRIRDTILKHGESVLCSKEFREACFQRHHIHATVASHSLNVAVISLTICGVLSGVHIRTDKKVVVQAALCHDLGILGREKFSSQRECCCLHPVESAVIAGRIIPDCTESVKKAILSHMWPAGRYVPENREALILTMADKIAAAAELMHFTQYHCRRIAAVPSGALAVLV